MTTQHAQTRRALLAEAETTVMRASAFASLMKSPEGRVALARLSKPEQVAAVTEQAERLHRALQLLEEAGLD